MVRILIAEKTTSSRDFQSLTANAIAIGEPGGDIPEELLFFDIDFIDGIISD